MTLRVSFEEVLRDICNSFLDLSNGLDVHEAVPWSFKRVFLENAILPSNSHNSKLMIGKNHQQVNVGIPSSWGFPTSQIVNFPVFFPKIPNPVVKIIPNGLPRVSYRGLLGIIREGDEQGIRHLDITMRVEKRAILHIVQEFKLLPHIPSIDVVPTFRALNCNRYSINLT